MLIPAQNATDVSMQHCTIQPVVASLIHQAAVDDAGLFALTTRIISRLRMAAKKHQTEIKYSL